MSTFLSIVGGVVVGFLLLIAAGFVWFRIKVGHLGALVAGLQNLPPFRIRLVPSAEAPWRDTEALAALTSGFESMGYEPVGDFEIPEMEGTAVRGFRNDGAGILAAIYDVPPVGIVVDLVLDLLDGTRLHLTTAPQDGLDQPTGVYRVRVSLDTDDPDTPRQLHARLLMESRGREPMLLDSSFEHAFVEAYTQEMNWRIQRGGVTADEIRREAEMSGQSEPSDQTVEMIRAAWRNAIDEFVGDEVRRAWLSQSAMALTDWERDRDRFVVVHEYGDESEHIDTLAWTIVEGTIPEDDDEAMDRSWEAARQRLAPAFEGVGLREGFAAAQQLLPEKRRYELLGRLDDPWPADCYLVPEDLRPVY